MIACQTPPTKVKENLTVGPNPDRSRIVTDKTVVLDARPLFAFSAGHLPVAQPVRWDFFGQESNRGLLRKDTVGIARELARLGVAPDRHIIVVGLGRGGLGEEGRIAWMLAYLGINNVSFAREGFFTMKRKTGGASSIENAPEWTPQIQSAFLVDKVELREAMKNPGGIYRIIDVRPSSEYLGKNPDTPLRPDIGAINVPWTQFIDDDGFPNPSIGDKLSSIGITPDKRIVLISDEGVRSALVTAVLIELGYKSAGNFAGGFQLLFPRK